MQDRPSRSMNRVTNLKSQSVVDYLRSKNTSSSVDECKPANRQTPAQGPMCGLVKFLIWADQRSEVDQGGSGVVQFVSGWFWVVLGGSGRGFMTEWFLVVFRML